MITTAYHPSASPKPRLCGPAWLRPPTLQCWVQPLENAQEAVKPKHQQEKTPRTFPGGKARHNAAPEMPCTTRQTPLLSSWLPQCLVPGQLRVIQCPKDQCSLSTSEHPPGDSSSPPLGAVQTQHGEKNSLPPSRKAHISSWQKTTLHLLGVKSTWLGCY